MNTAIYIPIDNYSKNGEMGVSRHAINSIVSRCLDKMIEEEAANPSFTIAEEGSKVALQKDGVALITVHVNIASAAKVTDTCKKIQKEISDAMTLALDTLPIEVKVRVEKIG